ncbi:hypothetical protein [Candidatus Poriferisodalis sp.]|uniref:hypothetical protein n=1 Tax=Candidatus Poriferisodalis sp. TaxID=3101277 RepID=UPI003B0159EA
MTSCQPRTDHTLTRSIRITLRALRDRYPDREFRHRDGEIHFRTKTSDVTVDRSWKFWGWI